MRDQDEIDVVADDTQPLQGRQRGGAAIDQEIDALASDVKAGVVPSARTERVTAADKSYLHGPDSLDTEINELACPGPLSPARRAEQPRQQPDRDHDHG